MKLTLVSAVAVAAGLAAATPASAATYVLGTFGAPATVAVDRGGNNYITANGPNTDTYSFTLTNAASIATSILSNSAANGVGQFDFTSVFLSGGSLTSAANYSIFPRSNGNARAELAPLTLAAGSYTLTVSGNVSGQPALYSGNLSFSPAAVPEPASWALMLAGFGAVGFALRRRSKVNAAVRFA